MRFRARRVIVKARVVKLKGAGSRAAYAHLRYLQREGASLERSTAEAKAERDARPDEFDLERRPVGPLRDGPSGLLQDEGPTN